MEFGKGLVPVAQIGVDHVRRVAQKNPGRSLRAAFLVDAFPNTQQQRPSRFFFTYPDQQSCIFEDSPYFFIVAYQFVWLVQVGVGFQIQFQRLLRLVIADVFFLQHQEHPDVVGVRLGELLRERVGLFPIAQFRMNHNRP